MSVTQAFDKNYQEVRLEINKKIKEYENNPEEKAKWETIGKLVSAIGTGLYAPTDGIAGSLVAAASPELANQIGQYFKDLKANQNNELTVGQEIAHKLAHGILGAAVAAATGQDVTNGALAGAGAEILGEQLTKWLYPNREPSDLTAEEKNLVSSIVGLGTAGIGLATGNGTTDVATGGMIGQNAVENNQMGRPKDDEDFLLEHVFGGEKPITIIDGIQEVDKYWVATLEVINPLDAEALLLGGAIGKIAKIAHGDLIRIITKSDGVEVTVKLTKQEIKDIKYLENKFGASWENKVNHLLKGKDGHIKEALLKQAGGSQEKVLADISGKLIN